ncbi:murein biosynthesis integral membrane protein MurJ [Chelatococcus reniformis]|uniref:Probable lipid II flippase MurJ n=1 Tax=Chelatococcus reniformis TaxID=1494448 RepID=A0A916UIV2_9HYPH|nr:murein biosynthesis integral membrane protein MurJ [Chelatococcus reniformis]GGC73801.1 putative lipid II flippase MurJ [Chelatococcus reniformis]
MLRKILSVGGFTLLSRLTGFVRDVMMAAVMGIGPVADAFVVAFKLPNHFRAIFGEGALNAAFVPAYSRIHETRGSEAARLFSDRLWTAMVALQAVLLVLAWIFMPQLVELLAPGFVAEPQKFELAVTLTRITFPYLLFITLVTLISGELNAVDRFAAAAAAPILLNVAMVAALAVAFLFPTAGHAVAWGVTISGLLQLALVVADARRAGIGPRWRRLAWDDDMRRFFKVLGPAVVGSAGVQIAMFADTIIASLLPTGAVSSIYYADRLYQLPVGVVGIAAGTVLLPEMSRKLALHDVSGAHGAQNRSMALTLLLAAPFAVAFLTVPTLIMQALFGRGAFTAADAAASGAVLAAYAIGLPAIVLIRSAVASFYARHDTTTPLIASLTAVAVNVALKIVLAQDWGAPGLAAATAVGAWVNVALLIVLATRRDWMSTTPVFLRTVACIAVAAAALIVTTVLLDPIAAGWAATLPAWQAEAHLAVLALAGLVVYGGLSVAGLKLTGVGWRGLR